MAATRTDTMESIAEQIRARRFDEAKKSLDRFEVTDENRSEVMFLRGYLQELSYERKAALATYEAVLAQDPDHTEAAFRAALLYDQAGDDKEALRLYEACTSRKPVHVNAMLNMALLYEERGRYSDAEACVIDVLNEFPNHRRARRFLKSVESSAMMVYDEQSQGERDRRSAILDMPLSDFELSVRSRNCLRQMNLRTLGDLLRTTEAELLSYKNFGETSLAEIQALLSSRGLRLGQSLLPAELPAFRPQPAAAVVPPHLIRSVAELELSVRSRKALQRLGVSTIAELAQRSEPELLAVKNFGQTSLTEIKRELAKFNLTLRG